MPEFLPLRVEIRVDGLMVVPDRHPLMLDALFLAMLGERLTLPFKAAALPLQSVTDKRWPKGSFVWLASALQVDWHGPSSDRIMTRNARPLELLDDADGHNATSVNFAAGLTRASRRRIALRHAGTATGWCLGDPEAVAGLLSKLQFIGANRHAGHGQVREVQVQQDPAGLQQAWARPLPGPHAKDPFRASRVRVAGRATAPYWDRDLQQQAWWPAP